MGKRVKGNDGKASPPKRVVQEPARRDSRDHIIWRFGRLDLDTSCDFSWHRLEAEEVQELEKELAAFQALSVSTLQKKGWLKFIGTESMETTACRRLAEINNQEDGLWQLHLSRHKWRVWGFFDEPEFYFLWWDKNHDVATGKSRHRKS